MIVDSFSIRPVTASLIARNKGKTVRSIHRSTRGQNRFGLEGGRLVTVRHHVAAGCLVHCDHNCALGPARLKIGDEGLQHVAPVFVRIMYQCPAPPWCACALHPPGGPTTELLIPNWNGSG